jgi:phosphatidylserine decarboxylase
MVLSAGAWWWREWAGWIVAGFGLALCAWCVWFFRDPQREIPDGEGVVVSAADGVVMRVEEMGLPEELRDGAGDGVGGATKMRRVVVFLNVFDVHVNRAPLAGRVMRVAHRSGPFAHAGRPEAERNERRSMLLELPEGGHAAVCQITGLIARRIINRAKEGQAYRAGERFGLIRFGSRTDVYLPASYDVVVSPGQRVKGGASVIAVRGGASAHRGE